ncbi:MAG: biopolymer transporter ExbD [Myxococcales bacterium]|nr:biopolymer transporter ExbD [Myxococcales bacterium]
MGVALDTGKGKKGVRPNINVTPLVDVVLVLLIIFMVIIPNMQDGKPIELVNVFNPDKDEEGKDEPLTVTIDRNGVYTVEDQDMARTQAISYLQGVYARTPKRKLLIRGDAKLKFAEARDFFRDVQNIGFGGVALAVGTQRSWDGGSEVK